MSAERPGVGALIGPVQVQRVAHGGHAVGRHEGRVVFIRHALPGEDVMVRLTDTSAKNYDRGDAVEVLSASPDRVQPSCPITAECGGCDLQHVSAEGQLAWKTAVLAEQLDHLAQITQPVPVEPVPLDGPGPFVGWRTRMRYHRATSADGDHAGMRRSRSHEVVPLPPGGCLIADPRLREPALLDEALAHTRGDELVAAVGGNSEVALRADSFRQGPALLTQRVDGRDLQVSPEGFWQVHPRAAQLLTEVVIEALDPRPGELALDLYCGVGLFAAALLARGARVRGVELDQTAVRQARLNVPQARFEAGRVDRSLARIRGGVDLAVLDPSRTGAGAAVIRQVSELGPRAIAHIGCDPAAFARDLASYAALGWRPAQLRAFDLFPQTHHLEAFALLLR